MTQTPAFIVSLHDDTKKTLARFPISIIIATLGTGVALYFSTFWNSNRDELEYDILRVLLTLICLFPLSISGKILVEQLNLTKAMRWMPYLFALIYAMLLFFATPPSSNGPFSQIVAMELVAFLSPITFLFLAKKDALSFWSFTKNLITRLLITGVFSAALFIGASLIIKSADFLFNFSINGEIYPRIWIIVVGIVASWFFLSGISEKISSETSYPDLLKKFVTYILVPLLGLYTLVLYIYGIKIIATHIWPQGDTVYMIIGYLLSAFATYAIAYPLTEKNTTWRKLFRGAIVAWIPILILFFASLHLRIDQYGITMHRYYVVLFGIFFVVMALYLSLSKKKNLIFIPLITSAFILLSQFGPLSAQTISLNNQMSRLEKVLTEQGLLKDGKLVPASKDESYDQVSSTLWYLNSYLTLDGVEKWLPADVKNDYSNSMSSTQKSDRILEYLYGTRENLTSNTVTSPIYSTAHFYLDVENPKTNAINLQGYQYMIRIKNAPIDTAAIKSEWYGKLYTVSLDGDSVAIWDLTNENKLGQNIQKVATFPIAQRIEKIDSSVKGNNDVGLKKEQMIFDGKTRNFTYSLIVTDLFIQTVKTGTKQKSTIQTVDGYLLIRK